MSMKTRKAALRYRREQPPYVSAAEMRRLPREHRAEPGKAAGRAGRARHHRADYRRRGGHLTQRGFSSSRSAIRRIASPPLPKTAVTWSNSAGHSEVFLLRAAELPG